MLKIAAVFSDNMVLQRGKEVAVWGTGDKGIIEAVVLDTAGNVVSDGEAAVADGRWQIMLGVMQAGGPYKLVVESLEERVEFNNVMIGEVFLAGGQSNMELELVNSLNGADAVAKAEAENVRFYYTPKHAWDGPELAEAEMKAGWELCTPDTCGRWSAVGYYFARKLADELGVTVGIIGCNWGGTSASCWTSRESLEEEKALSPYLEGYDKIMSELDIDEYVKAWKAYEIYQAEFDKNVGNYYATNPNPSWDEAIRLFGENQYPGPMGPRNWTRPYGLYETMIKHVAPYTLAGFLFYQGEEDDHRPETYKTLLSALIRQWRKDWNDDGLPFMIVQLPGFLGEGGEDFKNWPLIREAQMDVYKTVDNTGIAVTIELGDKDNIHPVDKKPVGERLAMQAMYQVYHNCDAEKAFSPTYCGYDIRDGKVYISFENADLGLVNKTDVIENFEIAGEDKVYYPAKARIVSAGIVSGEEEDADDRIVNVIELSSDMVREPEFARYCWSNYCDITLFGKNGLPVAPFRTSREDGSKWTGSRNGLMV